MNDFLQNRKRIVFCFSLMVAILFGTRNMGHAQSPATVTDAETLVEVLNAYAPDAAYVSNPGEVTITPFELPLNGAEIVFSLDEPLRILQNGTLLFGTNMRLEKGELYFYVNFQDLYTPGWQNCTMTVAPSTRLEIEGFEESFNGIGNTLFDIQGGEVDFHHIYLEETVSVFAYGGADVTIEDMTSYASFNINEANVTGDINVQSGKIDIYKGTLTFTDGAAYSNYGEGVINLLGDEAVVNVEEGGFSGFYGGPITVEKGTLNVSGGYICASLRGGSFNMSDGLIDIINIEGECDIQLSGGRFAFTSGLVFKPGVRVQDSKDLLADGYTFFNENFDSNMLYKLGNELETTPYYMYSSEIGGMVEYGTTYAYANLIAPENTPTHETAAYQAAQSADVGPNGKDVKVVSDKIEIYTPKGLAWLAFVTNDTYNIQPGKEYFSNLYNANFYLKNDLDMTNYGEDWPSINAYAAMFDGEGHRIYNLDIVSHSPSPFDNILTLKNLTVEGNYRMITPILIPHYSYGGHMAGLVNNQQNTNSLIVNCAFKGTLRNDFQGETNSSRNIAGLVCTNNGRIENCYVNPCGEGIICGDDATIGGLVNSNLGYIENCYSGAGVDFNGSGCKYDPLVYENADIWGAGVITNCYTATDVSLDILNENVRAHVPLNADDPAWKEWSADPDYQCGMPYLFAYREGTEVANETIEADDSHVFTSGGQIIVMTSRPQTVRVIAMSGAVIASEQVAGQKAFAGITPGNYIVVVGEKVLKIHL